MAESLGDADGDTEFLHGSRAGSPELNDALELSHSSEDSVLRHRRQQATPRQPSFRQRTSMGTIPIIRIDSGDDLVDTGPRQVRFTSDSDERRDGKRDETDDDDDGDGTETDHEDNESTDASDHVKAVVADGRPPLPRRETHTSVCLLALLCLHPISINF